MKPIPFRSPFLQRIFSRHQDGREILIYPPVDPRHPYPFVMSRFSLKEEATLAAELFPDETFELRNYGTKEKRDMRLAITTIGPYAEDTVVASALNSIMEVM